MLLAERAQLRLQQQRKFHRVRWLGENDEERITRRADLLTFLESGEDVANDVVMMLNHHHRLAVAEVLLEFSRADDVGEQQREQPDAVLALKFRNPTALLICRWWIHLGQI